MIRFVVLGAGRLANSVPVSQVFFLRIGDGLLYVMFISTTG